MPALNKQSILIHTGFVLTGVTTTLLGPMIPALSERWSLDDTQAGYLFTAQFAGSLSGVGLTSRLTSRIGYSRLLPAGYALMCLGVAALSMVGFASGIGSVYCFGVGLGIVIPGTNLFISELKPGTRAASLNLLNFVWTIGAVAGAPVIALLARNHRTDVALIGLSIALGLICFLLYRFSAEPTGKKSESVGAGTAPSQVWRNQLIPLLGALIFLYVGTENAIAGWAASLALRIEGASDALWSLAPSTFWAAILIGRLSAPAILRKLSEGRLVLAGLSVACCGALAILLTTSVPGLLIALAVSGGGLASVFPNTIAMLAPNFGSAAARVGSLMFALAGLGGATLPWAVGWASTQLGSLRMGFGVSFLSILLMIILQGSILMTVSQRSKEN